MNIGIVTTWFERGAAYVSRQFMDVLQITNPLPFQLCILKLQVIVEDLYAKCPQNKNRIACITQSPYWIITLPQESDHSSVNTESQGSYLTSQ